MARTAAIKMPGTPRPWMNAIVRSMLRTPGVRRLLGRTFAIITVTGSVSGSRYTTPVQYFRHGGHYVVLSQRKRTWWRNIRKEPSVQLIVQGETLEGQAEVTDAEAARPVLAAVLEENPRVARFYGLGLDDAGAVEPAAIDQLLEHVVVIVISPDA